MDAAPVTPRMGQPLEPARAPAQSSSRSELSRTVAFPSSLDDKASRASQQSATKAFDAVPAVAPQRTPAQPSRAGKSHLSSTIAFESTPANLKQAVADAAALAQRKASPAPPVEPSAAPRPRGTSGPVRTGKSHLSSTIAFLPPEAPDAAPAKQRPAAGQVATPPGGTQGTSGQAPTPPMPVAQAPAQAAARPAFKHPLSLASKKQTMMGGVFLTPTPEGDPTYTAHAPEHGGAAGGQAAPTAPSGTTDLGLGPRAEAHPAEAPHGAYSAPRGMQAADGYPAAPVHAPPPQQASAARHDDVSDASVSFGAVASSSQGAPHQYPVVPPQHAQPQSGAWGAQTWPSAATPEHHHPPAMSPDMALPPPTLAQPLRDASRSRGNMATLIVLVVVVIVMALTGAGIAWLWLRRTSQNGGASTPVELSLPRAR